MLPTLLWFQGINSTYSLRVTRQNRVKHWLKEHLADNGSSPQISFLVVPIRAIPNQTAGID